METALRTAAIYFTLLIIFKIAGRRTLVQPANFDLTLLLIISEATQQATLSTNHSVIGSVFTVVTLVGVDTLLGYIKERLSQVENFTNGSLAITMEDGVAIDEKIKPVNISVDDILLAARQHHGIYELKTVRFVIFERNDQMPIIPKKE